MDIPTNSPVDPQTGSAPQYIARDGDATLDRDAALAVWHGNLGQASHMAEKYDWFYLRSPAGSPVLQLLMHADTPAPVGICAAGRRHMLRNGQPIRAGVLADLAVMPMHRSLGPALILQHSMFDAGRRELDLMYSFPNPKATPVFKRIGYRRIADMVRHVRVIRHARYVHRRFPRMPAWLASMTGAVIDAGLFFRDGIRHLGPRRLRAQWSERAPDIEALWQASPKPAAITALRNRAYLQWRFDNAPRAHGQAPFSHLLLFEGSTAAAWFATRSQDHVLQVHDFWSRDGIFPSPDIIGALLNAARAQGHAAVSIELATGESALRPWNTHGFKARSRRPVFGIEYRNSDDAVRHASRCVPADGSFDAVPDLHLTAADEDE